MPSRTSLGFTTLRFRLGRKHSFSIARIPHPKLPDHPPQPIRFAAFDYLNRRRTFESRVRGIKPGTNLGSRNNLGERLEKPEHLGNVPLICPIRRIAGQPRCHSPSGGSHEASESIDCDIYLAAELADRLRPLQVAVSACHPCETAAELFHAGFEARHLLFGPFQLLRGVTPSMDRICHESMERQDLHFCKQNCLHNCITSASPPHLKSRSDFQALGCADRHQVCSRPSTGWRQMMPLSIAPSMFFLYLKGPSVFLT